MPLDLADYQKSVLEAHARIRDSIRRTPLESSEALSRLAGAEVWCKWENEQTTGSFKLRGALNKLRTLSPEQRAKGIVSASTGNHGLAIGHSSRLEGVELTLFLPVTASEAKRKNLEKSGIPYELRGDSCEKTELLAREYAETSGKTFVSPYNDWEIVHGQGTLGLEIHEDLPAADAVLVPVGGGGLISGIGGFLKSMTPGSKIYGVEPESSAFMAASIQAGRLVEIAEKETIADAVAGGIEPGAITFDLCRRFVNGFIAVEEPLIQAAVALIHRLHQKKVEGAGALALAGLLKSLDLFKGKRVVIIASGGNIAPEKHKQIIGTGT